MFTAHPVRQLRARALLALCCLGSLSAFAQTTAKDGAAMPAATDPANAKAGVQPLTYVSVFGTYRVFADEPITSWRDANDLTGRIGGWRAYAREAREPEVPATQPGPPMPPKVPPAPMSQPGAATPPQGHGHHTKP